MREFPESGSVATPSSSFKGDVRMRQTKALGLVLAFTLVIGALITTGGLASASRFGQPAKKPPAAPPAGYTCQKVAKNQGDYNKGCATAEPESRWERVPILQPPPETTSKEEAMKNTNQVQVIVETVNPLNGNTVEKMECGTAKGTETLADREGEGGLRGYLTNVVLTFRKCESLGKPCASAGEKAGTI